MRPVLIPPHLFSLPPPVPTYFLWGMGRLLRGAKEVEGQQASPGAETGLNGKRFRLQWSTFALA